LPSDLLIKCQYKMDTKFTEQESMELMSEMIHRARNNILYIVNNMKIKQL
jgi:hypothetical protein